MNVLFITDVNIVGGATKSFVELVSLLRQKFSINIWVCTGSYTVLNEELEKINISSVDDGHVPVMEADDKKPQNKFSLEFLKYGMNYCKAARIYQKRTDAAVKKIERNIDMNAIDLIHTNSARNDIGCILSRKHQIPHVVHIREFGVEDFNCRFLRKNYCRFLNKGTDLFITVSDAVRTSWGKRGLDVSKAKVIYNGIRHLDILQTELEDLRNSECLKLVATGGIYPTKGQYQIIEAMGLLPEDVKKRVTLDLYGWSNEEYIKELMTRVEQLNLNGQVTWKGVVKDVHQILSQYHVGLTCSKAEGFGRVTAEYMHAGLGVIVSDTGANMELIENGKTGLVYKLNDYSDLSQQILRFFTDRDLLVECGKCAKLKARESFTDEINANNIVAEYRKLVK